MARSRRTRKRKSQAKDLDQEKDLLNDQQYDVADAPRRNRGRYLLVGLALLGLFVFFLPTIIAVTPLKQIAIDRAMADFGGKVTVRSLSLGWLSPIKLTGLSAVDLQGRPLLEAETITGDKSLLALAKGNDYGRFVIHQPVIYLQLRENGSNLEDALANFMKPSAEDSKPVPLELSVADGVVTVTTEHESDAWRLGQLNGDVVVYGPEMPLTAAVSGSISNADGRAGQFQTTINIDEGAEQLSFANGNIKLDSRQLPIKIASPVLSRFVEPIQIDGTLQGDLAVYWAGAGKTAIVRAETASVQQFQLAAPRRIGNDVVRLPTLQMQGEVSMTPDAIGAKEFVMQSEAGFARANGQIDWNEISEVGRGRIPASDFQADGEVDIAKLAAMLPTSLPLQQGLQIESGTIVFNASSKAQNQDRRLVLNAESTGLSALRNGQRINWRKPVRVVAAIRQTPHTMIIESLDCVTNFLTLRGTASKESGEFVAQGDLAQAMQEVNQFFDLGGLQLAGIVDGNFAWQFEGDRFASLADRPLRMGGKFQIKNPLVDWPGQTRWSQSQLDVLAQASGQWQGEQGARQLQLDDGKLEITSGNEKLAAILAEPVLKPGFSTPTRFHCTINGEIANWLAQLKMFLPIEARVTGAIDAKGLVRVSDQMIEVQQSEYSIENLDFQGYGLKIRESQIAGEALLAYNLRSGQAQIHNATVTSSAVAARGQNILFEPATTGTGQQGTLQGDIAFRADINRLTPWWLGPPSPDSIHWYGAAQGTVKLQTAADAISGIVALQVNDLIAAKQVSVQTPGKQNVSSNQGWTKLLEEQQLTLNSTLSLSRDFDSVRFSNLDLRATAAQIQASGSISDLSGTMVSNIDGIWNPDWQELKPLFESYAGNLLTVDGLRGERFQVRGPLKNPSSDQPGQPWLSPQLQIATAVAWQQGSLLGMPIGQCNINVQLNQGIATLNTGSIALSGGTLQLAPQLDLRGGSPVLTMGPGKILDQVQLTPEICRGWLKYVAPVLADATAARGQFTVSTTNVSVPLAEPAAADIGGAITLHSGDVGPGQLGQQLITLVSQVKALAGGSPLTSVLGQAAPTQTAWMKLPAQNVPFAVRQGRVFHDGLQFQIDDVIVQTRGSVGLDQTMQLVAQIPIQPQWVGGSRWTQGLQGQMLQIPISGTVSSPQLDTRSLQQISQQLLQQAAGSALQNEVQGLIDQGNQKLQNKLQDELKKGLGNLLGPKK